MSEADQIELLHLLRRAVPLLEELTLTPAAPPAPRVVKVIPPKPTKADYAAYLENYLPGISRYINTN